MSRILEIWRVTDFGRSGAEKAGGTAGCGVGYGARRAGQRVEGFGCRACADSGEGQGLVDLMYDHG